MDMKKILQAMDGATTKAEVNSSGMKKFLQIVKEAELNQPVIENIEDLGSGAQKKTNPDGTYEIGDGTGLKLYSADGKLIKTISPTFAGFSQETDVATGNVTKNYNSGPLNTTQTTDAKGNVVSHNTEYDLGVGKLATGQDAKGITSKSWQGRGEEAQGVVSNKDLYAMGNKDKEATYDRAMKQVAQANENTGMSRFLSIMNEGKSPHKVALPVQMAMQHYQTPVKQAINETSSVFKTYVALVENDIAEQRIEKQQLIRQYSQRIAEAVLMKERVVGGEVTPPGINRLTGKPIEPQPEPSAPTDTPAVVPLGKRFDPRFKNGPEPYTIDIDGVVYKFAGRNATGPGTGEIIKVPAAVIGIRGLSAVSVELGKDGMYYPAPATNESAPSAGLSKAKKSATVKKAQAGKDIGKPGKGFDELAKKTNTKVAAAAMWKNIKR